MNTVQIACLNTSPVNPHTCVSIGAHFSVSVTKMERAGGIVTLTTADPWTPSDEDKATLRDMIELGQAS